MRVLRGSGNGGFLTSFGMTADFAVDTRICRLWLTAAAADGFFGFRRAGGWNLGDFRFGRADVEALAELGVHFGVDVPVFLEERAGVFAALADALAAVAVPGAGFIDDVV